MANKFKYSEAILELESIISEIENEEIDVDIMADKVKRAAFLIKTCREKLKSTEEDVNKTLSGIEYDN